MKNPDSNSKKEVSRVQFPPPSQKPPESGDAFSIQTAARADLKKALERSVGQFVLMEQLMEPVADIRKTDFSDEIRQSKDIRDSLQNTLDIFEQALSLTKVRDIQTFLEKQRSNNPFIANSRTYKNLTGRRIRRANDARLSIQEEILKLRESLDHQDEQIRRIQQRDSDAQSQIFSAFESSLRLIENSLDAIIGDDFKKLTDNVKINRQNVSLHATEKKVSSAETFISNIEKKVKQLDEKKKPGSKEEPWAIDAADIKRDVIKVQKILKEIIDTPFKIQSVSGKYSNELQKALNIFQQIQLRFESLEGAFLSVQKQTGKRLSAKQLTPLKNLFNGLRDRLASISNDLGDLDKKITALGDLFQNTEACKNRAQHAIEQVSQFKVGLFSLRTDESTSEYVRQVKNLTGLIAEKEQTIAELRKMMQSEQQLVGQQNITVQQKNDIINRLDKELNQLISIREKLENQVQTKTLETDTLLQQKEAMERVFAYCKPANVQAVDLLIEAGLIPYEELPDPERITTHRPFFAICQTPADYRRVMAELKEHDLKGLSPENFPTAKDSDTDEKFPRVLGYMPKAMGQPEINRLTSEDILFSESKSLRGYRNFLNKKRGERYCVLPLTQSEHITINGKRIPKYVIAYKPWISSQQQSSQDVCRLGITSPGALPPECNPEFRQLEEGITQAVTSLLAKEKMRAADLQRVISGIFSIVTNSLKTLLSRKIDIDLSIIRTGETDEKSGQFCVSIEEHIPVRCPDQAVPCIFPYRYTNPSGATKTILVPWGYGLAAQEFSLYDDPDANNFYSHASLIALLRERLWSIVVSDHGLRSSADGDVRVVKYMITGDIRKSEERMVNERSQRENKVVLDSLRESATQGRQAFKENTQRLQKHGWKMQAKDGGGVEATRTPAAREQVQTAVRLQEAHQRIEHLELELRQYKDASKSSQKKHLSASERIKQQQLELSNMASEKAALEDRLTELQAKIKRLRQKSVATGIELNEDTDEIQGLNKKILALQTDIQELNLALDLSQGNNQGYEQKIKDLQTQVAGQTNQLRRAVKSDVKKDGSDDWSNAWGVDSIEDSLTTSVGETHELEIRNSELSGRVVDLTQTAGELRKKVRELTANLGDARRLFQKEIIQKLLAAGSTLEDLNKAISLEAIIPEPIPEAPMFVSGGPHFISVGNPDNLPAIVKKAGESGITLLGPDSDEDLGQMPCFIISPQKAFEFQMISAEELSKGADDDTYGVPAVYLYHPEDMEIALESNSSRIIDLNGNTIVKLVPPDTVDAEGFTLASVNIDNNYPIGNKDIRVQFREPLSIEIKEYDDNWRIVEPSSDQPRRVERRFGIECELNGSGFDKNSFSPAFLQGDKCYEALQSLVGEDCPIAMGLQQVLVEIVENCIVHSQATSVTIRMVVDNTSKFSIRIGDNGREAKLLYDPAQKIVDWNLGNWAKCQTLQENPEAGKAGARQRIYAGGLGNFGGTTIARFINKFHDSHDIRIKHEWTAVERNAFTITGKCPQLVVPAASDNVDSDNKAALLTDQISATQKRPRLESTSFSPVEFGNQEEIERYKSKLQEQLEIIEKQPQGQVSINTDFITEAVEFLAKNTDWLYLVDIAKKTTAKQLSVRTIIQQRIYNNLVVELKKPLEEKNDGMIFAHISWLAQSAGFEFLVEITKNYKDDKIISNIIYLLMTAKQASPADMLFCWILSFAEDIQEKIINTTYYREVLYELRGKFNKMSGDSGTATKRTRLGAEKVVSLVSKQLKALDAMSQIVAKENVTRKAKKIYPLSAAAYMGAKSSKFKQNIEHANGEPDSSGQTTIDTIDWQDEDPWPIPALTTPELARQGFAELVYLKRPDVIYELACYYDRTAILMAVEYLLSLNARSELDKLRKVLEDPESPSLFKYIYKYYDSQAEPPELKRFDKNDSEQLRAAFAAYIEAAVACLPARDGTTASDTARQALHKTGGEFIELGDSLNREYKMRALRKENEFSLTARIRTSGNEVSVEHLRNPMEVVQRVEEIDNMAQLVKWMEKYNNDAVTKIICEKIVQGHDKRKRRIFLRHVRHNESLLSLIVGYYDTNELQSDMNYLKNISTADATAKETIARLEEAINKFND